MERRVVIKQVLIMAGGLLLLPSCLRQEERSTIQLNSISITLTEEQLLAEIAETLIPKTDTQGAKELKLHLFVLKMLDDCYDEADQKQFIKGLNELAGLAHSHYSQSFINLPKMQKHILLAGIEQQSQVSSDLAVFYRIMKERTINGYLNSKYVMTHLVIWELVPGRYNGYFPVKTA